MTPPRTQKHRQVHFSLPPSFYEKGDPGHPMLPLASRDSPSWSYQAVTHADRHLEGGCCSVNRQVASAAEPGKSCRRCPPRKRTPRFSLSPFGTFLSSQPGLIPVPGLVPAEQGRERREGADRGLAPLSSTPWLPSLWRGPSGLAGGHRVHSAPPRKMTVAEKPQEQPLAVTHPSNCVWGRRVWACKRPH